MFYYQKLLLSAIQIIFCCFFIVSCSQKNIRLEQNETDEYKTEINQYSQEDISFNEKINQVRQQTELVDDSTEKMLNRNKKWFGLAFILFIWIAFQSLINYRKN